MGQYMRYHVTDTLQSHVALNCNMRLHGMLQYGMGSPATATTCHCSLQCSSECLGLSGRNNGMITKLFVLIVTEFILSKVVAKTVGQGRHAAALPAVGSVHIFPCAFPARNYPPIPTANVARDAGGCGSHAAFRG